MLLLTFTFAALALLYSLAWHNKPARERIAVRHSNRKQEARE